jgi:hypothetical protein
LHACDSPRTQSDLWLRVSAQICRAQWCEGTGARGAQCWMIARARHPRIASVHMLHGQHERFATHSALSDPCCACCPRRVVQERRWAVGGRCEKRQIARTTSTHGDTAQAARAAARICDSHRVLMPLWCVLLKACGPEAAVRGASNLRALHSARSRGRPAWNRVRCTHWSSDAQLTSRCQTHTVRVAEGARSKSSGARRAGSCAKRLRTQRHGRTTSLGTLHELQQGSATHIAFSCPYCACC